MWGETFGCWLSEWNSETLSIRNIELIPMQFADSTYTEIHTSGISASAQKTPAAASNKHFRTLLPLSQPRWQMQTSARTSTFSGPLMIYLGKTECYLLGEMRRVLGEEWYGRCCEVSVRQMKIFWCLKHPAGKRYCVLICTTPIQI